MSQQQKEIAQKILALVAEAHDLAKTVSKESFAAFVQDGNDQNRLIGNKYGATAADMARTVERVEKMLA